MNLCKRNNKDTGLENDQDNLFKSFFKFQQKYIFRTNMSGTQNFFSYKETFDYKYGLEIYNILKFIPDLIEWSKSYEKPIILV